MTIIPVRELSRSDLRRLGDDLYMTVLRDRQKGRRRRRRRKWRPKRHPDRMKETVAKET